MVRNMLRFVFLIAMCGSLAAQEPSTGPRLLPGFEWSQAASDRLTKDYASALESTATGAYDPAADKLLVAADKYTRDVFPVPSLRRETAATHRGNGDVLQVWWKFDESFGKGDLVLIDDPFDSNYWFRFSAPLTPTSSDLVKKILGLITWGTPQLYLRPREIFLPAVGAAQDHFLVVNHLSPYSNSKLHFEMTGFEDRGVWLIKVSIGKPLVRDNYPVRALIPERFPPLDELVRTWSFRRIWNEVGATYAKDGDLSEHRDRMLIDELVDRGLTTDEIVELMINTDPSNLPMRAHDVLAPLREHGKAKAVVPAIFAPVLKFYERTGPRAASAAEALFHEASRNCGGEAMESAALRVLAAGLFVDGPLRYLSNCSASQETLDRLERITVRGSRVFGDQPKESVREAIEKRMAGRK